MNYDGSFEMNRVVGTYLKLGSRTFSYYGWTLEIGVLGLIYDLADLRLAPGLNVLIPSK